MKTILKALVGSRAHGLAKPDSDFDWRGVFIAPTSDIILEPIGFQVKDTGWLEGKGDGVNKIDDTSYEIAKFLKMAMTSNPSVLEILGSPEYEILTEEGERLRELFPALWSSKGVLDAFGGYAHNQVKKMMEDKDGRRWSYAKHYIRTLIMGIGLLETNEITMVVPAHLRSTLLNIRDGGFMLGSVINLGEHLNDELRKAYEKNPDKQVDKRAIHEFLINIRKNNW
jgi:predicted nucleotidyltransferase